MKCQSNRSNLMFMVNFLVVGRRQQQNTLQMPLLTIELSWCTFLQQLILTHHCHLKTAQLVMERWGCYFLAHVTKLTSSSHPSFMFLVSQIVCCFEYIPMQHFRKRYFNHIIILFGSKRMKVIAKRLDRYLTCILFILISDWNN